MDRVILMPVRIKASAEKFPERGATEKTTPKNSIIKSPSTKISIMYENLEGHDPLPSRCRRPWSQSKKIRIDFIQKFAVKFTCLVDNSKKRMVAALLLGARQLCIFLKLICRITSNRKIKITKLFGYLIGG